MKKALIAALPRELALLTRGWQRLPVDRSGVILLQQGNILAACAGMGADRVRLAVEAAICFGPLDLLVSIGLAGACDITLFAGDVVHAGSVIDARTGERFVTEAPDGPILVTSDKIAGIREKQRFSQTYGAVAIDMEASAVARLAAAHGLPFGAIKGISDEVTAEMEGMHRFTGPNGNFRELAFALHLAVRPHRWGAAVQLGRSSARALRALTARLNETLSNDFDSMGVATRREDL